ncbi:MAG TPA: hypothetical protein VMU25_03580 [Candidatus Paceibacterota bacterium]|nr:hypothetical protein [Candidatus Paceibacterota bacterium]
MKVLRQDWKIPGEGCLTSISKDKAQLETTIASVLANSPETTLIGHFDEITIPDDCDFVDMVEGNTVFLQSDEMDIVDNAPEYK